jgi:hypothetical protein
LAASQVSPRQSPAQIQEDANLARAIEISQIREEPNSGRGIRSPSQEIKAERKDN